MTKKRHKEEKPESRTWKQCVGPALAPRAGAGLKTKMAKASKRKTNMPQKTKQLTTRAAPRKQLKVPASDLSTIKMVAGNEKKYTRVIDDGVVKSWVGIGWVEEREATTEDLAQYPTVTR
jgi:hypothetical protein